MTLQAQRISLRPQQFVAASAVRLMTRATALAKRRLVVDFLLAQLRDVRVARQANLHAIGLGQAGEFAGMRIVAVRAVSRRARMLHLGGLDQLGLRVVAHHAEILHVGLCQHHFPVFRRRVAHFALLIRERRMRELGQQLGRRRLVWIVALHAIRGGKRLILVRLLQIGALRVVAIDAQRRWRLGQVIIKLDLARFAGLVRDVARLAAHIQGHVPAALRRRVQSNSVAREAKIFFLVARAGLNQLKFVIALMRIVTLQTVALGGIVDRALDVCRILVGVAGEAQRGCRGGDQLDARHILINTDFVAAGAARGYRGVDVLPFGFIRVAFQAGCRVGVLLKWNRVNVRVGRRNSKQKHQNR